MPDTDRVWTRADPQSADYSAGQHGNQVSVLVPGSLNAFEINQFIIEQETLEASEGLQEISTDNACYTQWHVCVSQSIVILCAFPINRYRTFARLPCGPTSQDETTGEQFLTRHCQMCIFCVGRLMLTQTQEQHASGKEQFGRHCTAMRV